MGLSGRKVKQRIPHDPRNLSWADDASRFGSTYLSKLGFDHTDKNATLGTSGVGLTQHLKVHHKLDMFGIGAQHTKDPNGIAWKQNRDFENLLKRLNANSEDPTEDGVGSTPIDGFLPAHVDELTTGAATVGPEPEGGDEERRARKETKNERKKRLRDNGETAETEERRPKKRKKVQQTTTAPLDEPSEVGMAGSNSTAPETVTASGVPHWRGRAHRARFIASKRLAATSSIAVAEILGIPSSSVTPLSASRIPTPEVMPEVEHDEHKHLTVSSKSVADYFKEKMRLVLSKPSGSETGLDGTPRAGIGSQSEPWSHDRVGESGELSGGLGMGLLAKMSMAGGTTETLARAEETPGGKGVKREQKEKRKRRREDGEGKTDRKSKKSRKKLQATSG